MKDIIIVGAGGFGREVQWLIERINQEVIKLGQEREWNILGYLDDGVPVGTDIDGYRVLGKVDYLNNIENTIYVTCAIGASKVRKKVVEPFLPNKKIIFPNLVDPSVLKSNKVKMGRGNIICAGNILTVDIYIQDFCIINLDCTVGHDAQIASFFTAYPSANISGMVNFEDCVELGTGAHVIQGITVKSNTIIGAGSVVIRDLPGDSVAVGNPCKVVKRNV